MALYLYRDNFERRSAVSYLRHSSIIRFQRHEARGRICRFCSSLSSSPFLKFGAGLGSHGSLLHSSYLHFLFLACLCVLNRRSFSITLVSTCIWQSIQYGYGRVAVWQSIQYGRVFSMAEYSVWQSILQSILAWSKVIVFLRPCFDNLARERIGLNLQKGGSPLRLFVVWHCFNCVYDLYFCRLEAREIQE